MADTPDPFVTQRTLHALNRAGFRFAVPRATVPGMESAPLVADEPPRPVVIAVFQVHGEAPMLSFEWKDNITLTVGAKGADVDASYKVEGEAWALFFRANNLEPGQVFCTARVTDMTYQHITKGSRAFTFPELSTLTIS